MARTAFQQIPIFYPQMVKDSGFVLSRENHSKLRVVKISQKQENKMDRVRALLNDPSYPSEKDLSTLAQKLLNAMR